MADKFEPDDPVVILGILLPGALGLALTIHLFW